MHVLFTSSLFADEKHRQYHEQEETAEMIAARIDRDVVSEKLQVILLHVCEILQLSFVGRLFPTWDIQFWRKAFQAASACYGRSKMSRWQFLSLIFFFKEEEKHTEC